MTHCTQDVSFTHKQSRFLQIPCRLAGCLWAKHTGQFRQIQRYILPFSLREKGIVWEDVSLLFRQKQLFVHGECTEGKSTLSFSPKDIPPLVTEDEAHEMRAHTASYSRLVAKCFHSVTLAWYVKWMMTVSVSVRIKSEDKIPLPHGFLTVRQ